MLKEPVVISSDVSDWAERAMRLDEVPQTDLEVAHLAVKEGFSAKEAAEIALAVRAMGLAPDDIMPPSKACLSEGGAYFVHHVVQAQEIEFERNGKRMRLRQHTAIQRPSHDAEEEEDEQTTFETDARVVLPERGYAEVGTPESVENAKRLLFRFVPGHVRNRLAEIWAGGGDHMAVLKELIAVLYGIAEEIPG